MTYKELKNKIKQEQKSLALQIRNGKSGRKPSRRSEDNQTDYNYLERNQYDYRHRHIVYCEMLNNTPYEKVEQPRDDNKPSKYRLEKIQKEWMGLLDEAVRDCA